MARPRQFAEDDVTRVIRDQFWDRGYAATTLDDVMRATSLGKGSLYAAFGDKHEQFMRAVRTYSTDGQEAVRRALEPPMRAVEALRTFLLKPVRDPSGTEARRGCLVANSVGEMAQADAALAVEAEKMYAGIARHLAAAVRRAQQEGDIPADTDPVNLARALLAAQQGLVYLGRAGMDMAALTVTAQTLSASLLGPEVLTVVPAAP